MAKETGPWLPVEYKRSDAAAIQALWRGEATPDQQKRAMDFVLGTICMRLDMSFRPGPDGERQTAFGEGRRFVGNQIVKLAKLPLSQIKDD